jgi:adenylate cyclase
MLNIHVTNDRQDQQIEHPAGPLEFGRGPQRQAPRFVIEDGYVSRDHLLIEEQPEGRLRVTNLSQSQQIELPDGTRLSHGQSQVLDLPVRLNVGTTSIDVEAPAGPLDMESFKTVSRPASTQAFLMGEVAQSLRSLGAAPTAEQLALWMETVVNLQRAPADFREFYKQTAHALVDLIGLDLGMVLLHNQGKWEVAGHYTTSDQATFRYSRTLVSQIVAGRRTFYQDAQNVKLQTESLRNTSAIVASPIFGVNDEVAGVLYGARLLRTVSAGGIQPLEAQLVQLLAAAVGANLVRTVAVRTRVQFEQFFSAALVRELERDPGLLEGRNQEVTVLFSDLRGFTRLSERLRPEVICRLMRDVMERLSEQIMAHGGVIVDYAGDGILALWNAPVAQPEHAVLACRAARAMHLEMPGLNVRWQPTIGDHPLALGVGINTGPALVGNTGSMRKLKYGALGLTVNLASRIQDATKKTGVGVLISKAVRERLPAGFTTRSVGGHQLAGISGEVELYELCGDTLMLPS